MATVKKGLAPGHWTNPNRKNGARCVQVSPDRQQVQQGQSVQCASFEEHLRKEDESLDALPPDRLWRTQVADGYAYYFVRTEKPLTLLHIPYADGYEADPVMIRGLRLPDVREQQQRAERFRQLRASRDEAET